MYKTSHFTGNRIVLSSAILDRLQALSAAALKIYIYFCSRNQPIRASIPTIGKAAGLESRATVAALKSLRDQKLISCNPGKGNRPNDYQVVFSSLPASVPGQPSTKIAAISEPAKARQAAIPPEGKTTPAPAQPSIKAIAAISEPANASQATVSPEVKAAPTPEQPVTHKVEVPQPAKSPQTAEVPEKKATLRELIADCFRPVN